jgi:hypothetical protein
MTKRNRNIKNISIKLQFSTNIMANEVKTPIQNYFEKVLYENLHVNTGWIHTCDLIGRLFLGNLLTPVYYQELKVRVAHGLKVWNSHVFLSCLDLIRHNIGTKLKLNKYIFDISIPFCHHHYLSATLKQCFTEFAIT